MAGIGFELKKLFNSTGILAKLRAYGYTGAITAGPMLLGYVFLLTINAIAGRSGLSLDERTLLTSLITYALLFSMLYTNIFSMVMTRYISDLLYENKEGDVIPSLEGILCLILPVGGFVWAVFLIFSGLSFTQAVLEFCLFTELVAVWMMLGYLSAIKDYRGILLTYVVAISASSLVAVLGVLIFGGSVELILFSVVIGYGVMMAMELGLLYTFFPSSGEHTYDFLPWFDEYASLMLIGFATNAGLFFHIIIAWVSPIGVHVKGLFYSAPKYDVPALYAFMTVLLTTINFVASVEVNLYPKYRRYYDLFNGNGSITEIEKAEKEMLTVLRRELEYSARIQFYFTAIMLSIGLAVLERMPLGFDSFMEGYFRILCVGYGAYAIGNMLMLVLMYYTDYKGAETGAVLFSLLTTGGSIASLFVDMKYYGFAFAIGALVYCIYCAARLSVFTQKLPYHILSNQPMYTEIKMGIGTRVFIRIENNRRKFGKREATL